MKTSLRVLLLMLVAPGLLLATWAPLGPYGGHAQAIILDVNNPRVLLVGTKNGLLYRSDDAGEHWQPLRLNVGGAAINALVIDPQDSNIYYAGVADEALAVNGPTFAGVYKSTDAGQSWQRLEGMQNHSVVALALWPKDPRVIGAGTREGLFLTTDGGQSWRKLSHDDNREMTHIGSVAFDPANADVVYAGTPHLPWKTVDGGRTWMSIHQGMSDDSDVFSIAVDVTQPQRVYASACSGIYRSASSGQSWTRVQGMPRSTWRTYRVLQDPQRRNIVYAGTIAGLWKSVDGGVSFRMMGNYPYTIKSIVIDPQHPDTLYLATDRSGILKSEDGGKTVRPINNGFVNRNITHFAVVARDNDANHSTLYAGSIYDGDFGGLFVSQDGGKTWSVQATRSRLLEENLLSLAVSPTDDRVLFAGTYSGLLQSTDGGATWHRMDKPVPPPAPKAPRIAKGKRARKIPAPPPEPPFPFAGAKVYSLATAVNPRPMLFVGTSVGLFYSEDGGAHWSALEIVKDQRLSVYTTVVSKDVAKIFAITSAGTFLSDDRGQTWRKLQFEVEVLQVSAIALSAKDPNLLFAATSRGLYKSTDGGKSWQIRGGGLPVAAVSSVEIHPARALEVYVVQNGVIYGSVDSGDTWSRFDNLGLENAGVGSIAFNANAPDQMFALSTYRGVYYHEGTTAQK